MKVELIDYDQWHKDAGHKRRFKWRTRRKEIKPSPAETRHPIAVKIGFPHYVSGFSVTVPKFYSWKWMLECGHIIRPGSLEMTYEQLHPDEATEFFCYTCQKEKTVWEEERYKDYYWETPHKHEKCYKCKQCYMCLGHKAGCAMVQVDYLMELLFEEAPRKGYDEMRDWAWDTIREILDDRMSVEAINTFIGDMTE